MSRNIVFEGWLTKSPPTKRIWRTKWRRRWFALRHSGELPGQYFLDYYADRNCRRLKGTINLDLCEQVDAGLHMERSGSGSLDPKLRGSVFTIQTQSRTYHLEADCEAEMEKWVDAICSVCGLRATEDTSTENGTYQNSMGPIALNERYECPEGTGPYIRISECVTGSRAQDSRAFTFDPRNIVTSSRRGFAGDSRGNQMYLSQPLRQHNAEFSENESNLSEDECKSLNASHSNIGDWSVTKSFTKLAVGPKKNGIPDDGPPVPPRPPKTLGVTSKNNLQRDAYLGPKYNEPMGSNDNVFSMQYCNVKSLPPAVDRALKPRHSSHSISHLNSFSGQPLTQFHPVEVRADTLQYLDLDLQTSKPSSNKPQQQVPRHTIDITHGKSLSEVDADTDSCYKTVDFLKTEAFNITMQDAEASRSNHTQHLSPVGH
ncbi:GRB2-associated-binding protein 2 isoform X2 [Leguminivora glycinivorella]|uniref:GRB2-associated-binding protein 2 isoform X2 n=1 Tax=Leguminivora glycinivorella TaxID=1035111 RepID=UPI0020104865|nr:GRB2-associated-binding protein 2 isoform X2 [Leguminivora glycinivorella]